MMLHDLFDRVLARLHASSLISAKRFKALLLVFSPEMDLENAKSPRIFCRCRQGSGRIECAQALAVLPPPIQLGILLHELGHVCANAFGGDQSEIDADLWVKKVAPTSGYSYCDVSYTAPLSEQSVTAQNVQTVSVDFYKAITAEPV